MSLDAGLFAGAKCFSAVPGTKISTSSLRRCAILSAIAVPPPNVQAGLADCGSPNTWSSAGRARRNSCAHSVGLSRFSSGKAFKIQPVRMSRRQQPVCDQRKLRKIHRAGGDEIGDFFFFDLVQPCSKKRLIGSALAQDRQPPARRCLPKAKDAGPRRQDGRTRYPSGEDAGKFAAPQARRRPCLKALPPLSCSRGSVRAPAGSRGSSRRWHGRAAAGSAPRRARRRTQSPSAGVPGKGRGAAASGRSPRTPAARAADFTSRAT